MAEFGLTPPISVLAFTGFKDGGTQRLELSGGDGQTVVLCYDFRADQPEPRHLFVGVGHPSEAGGMKVPVGHPCELELATVMDSWWHRQLTEMQLTGVSPADLDLDLSMRVQFLIAELRDPSRSAR
ncbi:MAG: hypothetical protein AAF581_13430 [Planctomycetota bacterium]